MAGLRLGLVDFNPAYGGQIKIRQRHAETLAFRRNASCAHVNVLYDCREFPDLMWTPSVVTFSLMAISAKQLQIAFGVALPSNEIAKTVRTAHLSTVLVAVFVRMIEIKKFYFCFTAAHTFAAICGNHFQAVLAMPLSCFSEFILIRVSRRLCATIAIGLFNPSACFTGFPEATLTAIVSQKVLSIRRFLCPAFPTSNGWLHGVMITPYATRSIA